MAKFCGKCGSPLNDTAVFCVGCGAPVPAGPPPPAAQPAAGAIPPPPPFTPVAAYVPGPPIPPPAFTPVAYVPGPAIPPAQKSNTLLKVLIACVVLLFVGTALAVAGMWYAAHKIKQKVDAAAAQAPELASVIGAVGGLAKSVATSSNNSPSELKGDPCRFLTTLEVSQAIGVPVIRADGDHNICTYTAKGDPADMTARHMSAMVGELGGPGVDAKTQKMVQQFAGGLFSQQESQDKDMAAQAAKGEVQVLMVDFEAGNADAMMKLNRATMGSISGVGSNAAVSGTGDLNGIGDDAFVTAGGMLIVRKGNTVARFTYISCPCNTASIKPLAKLAASRL